jgi:uncharacterized integral membrane protein
MLRKIVTVLVLVPLALVLVALSVANRGPVTLTFNPFDPSANGFSIALPLYLVLFATLALGVLVGGIAAWLRQGRWRGVARRAQADVERLTRERDELKRRLTPQTGTTLIAGNDTRAMAGILPPPAA